MEHADKKNKCDGRFINTIQMKAKYLFHAFSILIDRKENEPLTWHRIFELAIEKVMKIALTLDHFNILKSLRWATSSQCNMNWAILALSM